MCHSPSVTVAGGEAHKAVGKVVVRYNVAELAAKERSIAHGAVPVTLQQLVNEITKAKYENENVQ